jgi:hypothetical protein
MDGLIVSALIADMLANFTLREDGVTRDDGAVERQTLEQHHSRCDLVLIRRHRQFTNDRVQLSCEGGKNVNGFGVETTAAFQRLAVQSQMLRPVVTRRNFPNARLKLSASSAWKK